MSDPEAGGQPPAERRSIWEGASQPEPIPGSTWQNPVGSLAEVAAYERHQRALGESLDPAVVARLTNARQLHLEKVVLPCGLPLVVIRDDDGNEVFDDSEYVGLVNIGSPNGTPTRRTAAVIGGTNLGNGYYLKMVVASPGRTSMAESYPGHIDSFVGKEELDCNGGVHELRYSASPQERQLRGGYTYATDEGTQVIWFGGAGDGVTFTAVERVSGDQTDVQFDENGRISMVTVAGRHLLGHEGVELEYLAPRADQQRGVISVEAAMLDDPRTRSIVIDALGIALPAGTSIRDVRVATDALISSMIANIDGDRSSRPRDLLARSLRWS